ncbi:MAG: 2-C-methyl-D-erythritol 2,4-cyclodiphosphate synthase [Firmicutes bacterium]|nr:2-C-methyl-D-erythritol 2,4-cyclodiphosphate synthase [Bacillota bacterium]
MRIGQGFDVHRLVSGRRLILGGVEVPYEMGLLGHSDADVLIHALMDALLGAIGTGDIGVHFPDRDPDYKDIDSTLLLQRVLSLINNQGYQIANLDATIIAERPKLAGYIPQIRQRIADLARIDIGRVSIKATTTEGLGFTGRGEGIGVLAVVLLEQKQS